MARKKGENIIEEKVETKTLSELTDREFVIGIDQFGRPFYLDYLTAPYQRDVAINGYLSKTDIGILAKNAQTTLHTTTRLVEEPIKDDRDTQNGQYSRNYATAGKNSATANGTDCVKKRSVLLIFIAVLSLAFILVSVLGLVAPAVLDYVGIYKNDEGASIGMLDPVFGLVDSLAKTNLTKVYPYYAEATDAYGLIPVYAVSCAVILALVCMVIIFIKSLVALCGKRDERGFYKKRTFGFLSVVAFLCSLIVLVGGLYVGGGSITGIVDFMLPKDGAFTANYGLYAMIAIPILVLIFTSFSYKRAKKK